MGSFNFKSVGKTQEQQLIEQLTKSPSAIGIKTPLRLGNEEGLLGMHYSLADTINDNLRNLIMTNWGSHLGVYNLGANLLPLTSEFTTQDDFDSQAVERISAAVSRWMPYVSLEDFLSEVDRSENKNTAVIRINITYSVPSLSVTKRALQVTLYVI